LPIDPTDVDVSIVLVAYNRARFIRHTLESIVQQTYPKFEVLICDDCSTDDTGAVCQEYVARDSRFKYVRNGRNLGMPGNLNAGVRRARCEFIANLHDGDIYAPTLIERWRAALIKYPTAGFVFNRYRHLSPDGRSGLATTAFPELMTGNDFLKMYFADRALESCVWGTVMARKSAYEKLGFFDDRYGFFSDIDMWIRIAEVYDVAHVPEVLIDLPHKKSVPRLFPFNYRLVGYPTVFQIHWNARKRYYHHEPITMVAELCKLTGGFVAAIAGRAFRRFVRSGRQIIAAKQDQ